MSLRCYVDRVRAIDKESLSMLFQWLQILVHEIHCPSVPGQIRSIIGLSIPGTQTKIEMLSVTQTETYGVPGLAKHTGSTLSSGKLGYLRQDKCTLLRSESLLIVLAWLSAQLCVES